MGKKNLVNRPFLLITLTLVILGFFIFASAALGFLTEGEGRFTSLAISQLMGLVAGLVLLYFTSRISYKTWGKYSFYFFLGSIILTLLVFIPGIGFEHGGARRWIDLGFTTFQPAEILKIAFVVYWATWLSGARKQLHTIQYGMLPLILIMGVVGGILAFQPDMGTLLIIAVVAMSMFIIGGGKWSHIFSVGGIGILGLSVLAFFKPYVRARLLTFLDPTVDPLGASYQLQQSLIAIGSGRWFGRGFGQSVQKFNFLPEPIGDSIFAVFSEEWGFIGASLLILLFVFFLLHGLKIASRAPTIFSRLAASGIVITIVAQSFVNIASMLGVLPLTGMPLLFVSHGGSALFVALGAVGIVLNISRYQRE